MLKIYGASDDLIYANIELKKKCSECGADIEEPTAAVVGDAEDEIGAYDQKIEFTIGDPKEGAVIVEMNYVNPGVWAALVRQADENVPIPWPVTVATDPKARPSGCGHSVVVFVDCPNGTPVAMSKESA